MPSNIEWTDETWNPVAGCSIVSPGCRNCYAMSMARRLEAMGQEKYAGLTKRANGKTLWTGKVNLVPEALEMPLSWRKPRRVFVNSMSDLFHEDVPDDFIDKVFAVMALCPQHTFQVLTKRAERMADYCRNLHPTDDNVLPRRVWMFLPLEGPPRSGVGMWPLPNVWLGVSCEDQQRADERIPWLLKTPAAVRFVSAEPLLGAISVSEFLHRQCSRCAVSPYHETPHDAEGRECLDWVIVGGESGPGARPCDVDWIRSIVKQCAVAGVACFVKQLGRRPIELRPASMEARRQGMTDPSKEPLRLDNKKGGDTDEWPEDLRVRQFPEVSHA